ncbi:MAG: transglycosylase SLT domain-containing protein, partial [Syntrophales bacterium]|nr:transglycosylase SLT domain-containing protein [Syntrophales bacterium]
MQESQWTKALENFQALEKDYVLLIDYVLYDMAACYEKSGEKDKAIATLKRIISDRKNSPLYRKAFRRIIEITKDDDINAALRHYDLYISEFPRDGKALWEKAELLEKAGMKEEAFPIWKEIFLSGSAYVLNAYEALKTKAYQPSREEIRIAASHLSEKENYRQAISLLENSIPAEEEEKYLLGRAYFHLRRYRDAIQTLGGVSSRDSRYLLALSLIRTNEKEAFYKLTEGLVKQGQKDLFNLLSLAVELKRREGSVAEAVALLQSMKELYPEKEEEVTWSQAWLAIRQRRLGDAEKLLSLLTGRNFSKQDKYLFWLGKVKIYQGQKGDVYFSQIKDQNSYYWFKAGKKGDRAATDNGREGLKTGKLPELPEELKTNFLRIIELTSLKMRVEAAQEARLVVDFVTAPYVPSFARLLVEIEDYHSLLSLGIRHNYPLLKYPLAFRDTVFKHAETYRIDPLLVTALMREESHFKNDAVSGAGALGVMQLMPATARRVAHIKNNEDLFDAEKNISLGVNYLSRLISRFKSLHYAVAAYNAGERNVEKWLAAGYRDEDEFTEDIPFSETKNYVFRVLKTYGIMKSLYGDEIKGNCSQGSGV